MGGDNDSKILEKFVLQIIQDKGLNLQGQELEDEKKRLLEELNERLDRAMVYALPDDVVKKMDDLIDNKGDEVTENEVQAVVYASQSKINDAVKNEMMKFREEKMRNM